MVVTGSGYWAPFKEILTTVESAVIHKRSDVYAELDDTLTKHKPAFINLLKNPAKNASHREQVQKANSDGIKIDGYTNVIKLTDTAIQEVLLLSDALDFNEFTCVELVLIAEQQLPNFPGFSKQLVASLLYHDGRRCIMSALKLLLTARPGVTWTLELDERIVDLIAIFARQLIDDGIVSKLLLLLEDVSLPKELKKLEDSKAICDGKHKKLITELIEEQQLLIADCLFSLACQYPLQQEECIKLIDYLKLVTSVTSDGSLDVVTIRVLLALLASFNCNVMDSAIENTDDEQYFELPYFKDSNFMTKVHAAVVRPDVQVWQTPGLKYIIQLCWALFVRTCSNHPHLDDYADIFEEDEGILDSAIDGDGFKYLRKSVIESNGFHKEEYFMKIIHSFVSTFIVKFPLKIKALRTNSDENARIIQAHIMQRMEPPHGLRQDFQDLLLLVSSLYKKDPLGLELNSDFWIPPEPLGGMFSPEPLKRVQQATDQKKIMLNKFVRLAGDILLQPLYVPFINMLTALSNNEQAACYCFRLLSANGTMERNGACPVSWDHFFLSIKQYYMSLRQIPDNADPRSHIIRHQTISPEELAGLESILGLIKAVTEHSESVRVVFCENTNWLPVASLLGLVCCPIPPSLKGLLLETLASFAKTSEITSSLWQSLEASQILQTTEETSSGTTPATKSGIAVELMEIETRNEAYPETGGFLKLLDRLTDVSVPVTLGAGHRIPGFDPYLNFLKDQVFLKFKTRAYQDPSEKWKIASAVLKIFVKILKKYEPVGEDFSDSIIEIQKVNFGKAAKPAGFQLLAEFLMDTPMLRMTLSIVDDIVQELKFMLSTHEMKEILEETVGYSLTFLECVLEKQDSFIDLARSSGASLILTPLDELLLSVNPRTGSPDYLFILGRFMTINNIKSSIVLSVVKIFKYACASAQVQKEIVDLLTQDEVSSREFLVGFSEHLELAAPEEEMKAEDIDAIEQDIVEENIGDTIRQNIVHLLISTLNHPTPNLAQYMLGFELRKMIPKTNLQDPGVGGFPKTCLHSVIEVLNRKLGVPGGSDASAGLTPKLSELLYKLIYMLCAHPDMGIPIRRYLRANTDFFTAHCQVLPFLPQLDSNIDELLYIRLANQQSWLLKTIAIEIRVVSASRMRSGLQQLLALLYNDQASPEHNSTLLGNETLSNNDSYFMKKTAQATNMTSTHSLLTSGFTFGSKSPNMILSLLSSLSFVQRFPPNLPLNFFDYCAIEQLILSCEECDQSGVPLCNVRKLYKILMMEINNSQLAVGAGQKDEIMAEVKAVLKHALDRNVVRESFHSKHSAFDAWRQVVEVTFAACPSDIFEIEKKQSILIEILQILIPKMTSEDTLPELTTAVAGSILSLMTNLWFTFTQLDPLRGGPESAGLPLASIHPLFSGIVECIMSASSGQPRMRANLYGAFMYYIQIGQMQISIIKDSGGDSIFGTQSKENWETNTFEILSRYGESFLDIIAKDSCQGPCIVRMMAMSVLDAVASLDWKHKYLLLMSSRGYLRVLIDQLLEDDVQLQNVLSLQPASMKPLYLFESKMAFMAKVAAHDFGAQTLLQLGLISRLTECQFLDYHVNKKMMLSNTTLSVTSCQDPFMPSLSERYSKIFTSFAKMLLSFLSSVGVHHQVALGQIQNLITNHKEVIQNILHTGSNVDSMDTLKQLSLTIAIISLLPISDLKGDAWDMMTDEQRHWHTFMNRVQRLMLGLLNKFSSTSCKKLMKEMLRKENLQESSVKTSPLNVSVLETQNMLLQIRSRLLTFCKNIVSTGGGLSGPYSTVMFAPTFSDNNHHETQLITGKPIPTKQLASLDLLVQELKDSPDQLKQCLEHQKVLSRKLESISDMNQDEIKEILSQEQETERLPFHQRQLVVHRILSKLVRLRESQANYLTYIIEQGVYVLWRHIDYYFMHCIPIEEISGRCELSISNLTGRARRLTDSTSMSLVNKSLSSLSNDMSSLGHTLENGVSKEELRDLKIEAVNTFTDSFWQKVLETDKQNRSNQSRLSFSSVLVRKIKGLIQLNA